VGKIADRLRRLDERAFRLTKRRAHLAALAMNDEAWTRHVIRQWRWMLGVAVAIGLVGSALAQATSSPSFAGIGAISSGLAFAAGHWRAEERRMGGVTARGQALGRALVSSDPTGDGQEAASRPKGG
jgi:hypothetical protein